MADNKIITFPGSRRPGTDQATAKPVAKAASEAEPGVPATAFGALTADQIKAIQLAQSGMGFVMVALKPTASGADFFTAVHGDATELRNAQDHFSGVIDRALARKGK